MLLLAFFIVMVLLLVWVATAEGPEENYYAYILGYDNTTNMMGLAPGSLDCVGRIRCHGNTITMMDSTVADVFSKIYGTEITPGIHLMNKEGQLVSPVPGGLKMAFKGLLGGGGKELDVGLSGVRVGLRFSPLGVAVLIILPLLLIGLIGFRFLRSRRPMASGG